VNEALVPRGDPPSWNLGRTGGFEVDHAQVVSELAPRGVLRAGINMSNGLLVTGATSSGDPIGVAPDMAAEIARQLDVPIAYVKFDRPSKLADAAGTDAWDIGLIGAEPARAEKIAFTPADCEIEATYIVPGDSRYRSIADVDCGGSRIAVRRGSAYDLWLTRHIKHATLAPVRRGGRAVQPIRHRGS
jgi:polar amino acid transport system substrate-binding protein